MFELWRVRVRAQRAVSEFFFRIEVLELHTHTTTTTSHAYTYDTIKVNTLKLSSKEMINTVTGRLDNTKTIQTKHYRE